MKKCQVHIPDEDVPVWISVELPIEFSSWAIRNAICHTELIEHREFSGRYIYIYDETSAFVGYYKNGVYRPRREEW